MKVTDAGPAVYQSYLVAGNGGAGTQSGTNNAVAVSTPMSRPCGVFYDTSNFLYITEMGYGRVRKLNMATGIMIFFAGNFYFVLVSSVVDFSNSMSLSKKIIYIKSYMFYSVR